MLEPGTTFEKGLLSYIVGVNGPTGTQCGILPNYKEEFTVLVLDPDSTTYPNKWDEKTPGLLLYCGTSKGQTKNKKEQNPNSKLNKHLKDEIFPIYVILDRKTEFISLGRFSRIEKYDDTVTVGDKIVYRFGLIARNIDEVEKILKNSN